MRSYYSRTTQPLTRLLVLRPSLVVAVVVGGGGCSSLLLSFVGCERMIGGGSVVMGVLVRAVMGVLVGCRRWGKEGVEALQKRVIVLSPLISLRPAGQDKNKRSF